MAVEAQTTAAPQQAAAPQTAPAPASNNGGGATPWLAFLVGVLVVAVIAFGAVMWARQGGAATELALPEAPTIEAPAADAPAN